jgi:hypothetical protein
MDLAVLQEDNQNVVRDVHGERGCGCIAIATRDEDLIVEVREYGARPETQPKECDTEQSQRK